MALLFVIVTPSAYANRPDPREDVVKQMRPASGIEAEPRSWWSDWPTWLIVGGLSLAAIALGASLALRLTRGRQPAVTLTAHQAALRDLQRIEAQDLPAKGELDRYHTELSNVVRRYLEQRFHIAATRQTTPEFLETMRNSSTLGADQQVLLREFLEQCDLAKFAGMTPSADQSKAVAMAARRFVEQTAH